MMWDIPATITAVTQLVNKFVPDRDAQIKLQAELQLKFAEIEAQQLQAQSDTNKVEAASSSVFVAGWRPFIGWVCGSALAWSYILQPVAQWALLVTHVDTKLPEIPSGDLFNLTLAMLGMAGWRTLDKIKDVATTRIK
jgi:hypothetical protein